MVTRDLDERSASLRVAAEERKGGEEGKEMEKNGKEVREEGKERKK